MADEPEVVQPEEQPNPPAPVSPPVVKPAVNIKLYILLVALVLIGSSGLIEVVHAYQSGQPINWEVMEKILDRLTALLSSSDGT